LVTLIDLNNDEDISVYTELSTSLLFEYVSIGNSEVCLLLKSKTGYCSLPLNSLFIVTPNIKPD